MNKNIEYLASASLAVIAVVLLSSYFTSQSQLFSRVETVKSASNSAGIASPLQLGKKDAAEQMAAVANGSQTYLNIRRYDLTGDGVIDLSDVSIVAASIRMNTYNSKADFNFDRKVNLTDLGMIRKAIGITKVYQHDYNSDGKVSFADVSYVASTINARQYNPLYDFDANGVIGMSDLLQIQLAAATNNINAYDFTADGKITFEDVTYVATVINNYGYNASYDFNADGMVGVADLSKIRSALLTTVDAFDYTRDGKVSFEDVTYVAQVINKYGYDANFDLNSDGRVDQNDLLQIRPALQNAIDAFDYTRDGKISFEDVTYVTTVINNYGYDANFDLNSDGRVDQNDLLQIRPALQNAIDAFDYTRDGRISFEDVTYVAQVINRYGYDANYDITSDGRVDQNDLLQIRSAYVSTIDAYDFSRNGVVDDSDVQYVNVVVSNSGYDANYDLNSDGRVDQIDLAIIQNLIFDGGSGAGDGGGNDAGGDNSGGGGE